MAKPEPARFILVAYLAFLGVVAFSGGSSRVDAASQPVVRLAAIILLGVLAVRPADRQRDADRAGYYFLAAVAVVVAIQLVPLPPALWTSLPGRGHYLGAAAAAGEVQPWRPINLTPDRGWNALFALLPPIAAFVAARRLRGREQKFALLALLAIVMASAAIGLAQVSAGGEDALRFYSAPPTGSAVGLFANRNHQALLLCCGIPAFAVWASIEAHDRARAGLAAAIASGGGVFLVLMIPTTGSRAGLLLGALALSISLVIAWPAAKGAVRSLSHTHKRIAAAGAILAMTALIAAALTFSRAEAVRRLFAVDPVEDARVRLLRPLFKMIRNFFPVGSGFGSFDPVYRGYEPFDNLALTVMNKAHDDYLQVALEAGLPGMALLAVFIGWWGWNSVRLWRRADREFAAYGRLGSVLLLLMLLASVADYPVRTPLMMVIAAQSAAWMLPSRQRHASRSRPDFAVRELELVTNTRGGS